MGSLGRIQHRAQRGCGGVCSPAATWGQTETIPTGQFLSAADLGGVEWMEPSGEFGFCCGRVHAWFVRLMLCADVALCFCFFGSINTRGSPLLWEI